MSPDPVCPHRDCLPLTQHCQLFHVRASLLQGAPVMKPFDPNDKLECLSLLSLVEYLRTHLQSGALKVAPLGQAKNPDLSRTFQI